MARVTFEVDNHPLATTRATTFEAPLAFKTFCAFIQCRSRRTDIINQQYFSASYSNSIFNPENPIQIFESFFSFFNIRLRNRITRPLNNIQGHFHLKSIGNIFGQQFRLIKTSLNLNASDEAVRESRGTVIRRLLRSLTPRVAGFKDIELFIQGQPLKIFFHQNRQRPLQVGNKSIL